MSSLGMPRTRSIVSARSRGVRPDRFGHVEVVGIEPVAAQHRRIRRFALQVEFGRQRVLDLGHDLARADLVGGRMRAVDERGDRLQQRDVAADLLLDVGAQHLDHDFARRRIAHRGQRGRMHLRDRRGGQRRGVEARERDVDRTPERLLDQRARGVAVERRDAILQQREFLGDVGRHEVAARGQDLAELDEDRPELLQRQAQAHAARLRTRSRARRAARRGASTAASVRPACRRADRRGDSAAARDRCARRAGPASCARLRAPSGVARARTDVRRRRAGRRHRRGRHAARPSRRCRAIPR